jgi:hypothetical protein
MRSRGSFEARVARALWWHSPATGSRRTARVQPTAGFDEHLLKPATFEQLEAIVTRFVAKP